MISPSDGCIIIMIIKILDRKSLEIKRDIPRDALDYPLVQMDQNILAGIDGPGRVINTR